MDEEWRYTRFEDLELTDLGNGFFGSNVVELDELELTFVKGDKGSGHGFHQHEDLVEILVFLEGGCVFTVGETDLNIKGGSLLFIPPGVNHKVHYNEKSKVLRIKVPRPSGLSGV
jgi:quercetin dioxygenase-like cupin family protein